MKRRAGGPLGRLEIVHKGLSQRIGIWQYPGDLTLEAEPAGSVGLHQGQAVHQAGEQGGIAGDAAVDIPQHVLNRFGPHVNPLVNNGLVIVEPRDTQEGTFPQVHLGPAPQHHLLVKGDQDVLFVVNADLRVGAVFGHVQDCQGTGEVIYPVVIDAGQGVAVDVDGFTPLHQVKTQVILTGSPAGLFYRDFKPGLLVLRVRVLRLVVDSGHIPLPVIVEILTLIFPVVLIGILQCVAVYLLNRRVIGRQTLHVRVGEGKEGWKVQLPQGEIHQVDVACVNDLIGYGVPVVVLPVQAEDGQVAHAAGEPVITFGCPAAVDDLYLEPLGNDIAPPKAVDVLEFQRPGGMAGRLSPGLDELEGQVRYRGIGSGVAYVTHRVCHRSGITQYIGHGNYLIIAGRVSQADPPQLGAKGVILVLQKALEVSLGGIGGISFRFFRVDIGGPRVGIRLLPANGSVYYQL